MAVIITVLRESHPAEIWRMDLFGARLALRGTIRQIFIPKDKDELKSIQTHDWLNIWNMIRK
jgi:hypothetical protein